MLGLLLMTQKTTTNGNGARKSVVKARAAKSATRDEAAPTCRALCLVRQWMVQKGLDVAKLSRKIDRTWDCTFNIVSGKVRPDVDAVIFFREEAGVPVNAWVEAGK